LKIRDSIIRSADKFGYYNKQQFEFLENRCRQLDDQVVFNELISIFVEEPDVKGYRQELVGRLLYKVLPIANYDLNNMLKSALQNFDPSIEHFIYYFVEVNGINAVNNVLKNIEKVNLSEVENNSLMTMKFWVRNYERWKLDNE
jgi:hypothetical protein